MHFLAAKPGLIGDEAGAIDLNQSAGDILFLSAADSDIALMAHAYQNLKKEQKEKIPSLKLANWMQLTHPASVDLYIEKTLCHAKIIVIRLLGGKGYWAYGFERINAYCQKSKIPLIWLPGDMNPDETLSSCSTVKADRVETLRLYWNHGGHDNILNGLRLCCQIIGYQVTKISAPLEMAEAGLYWPGIASPDLATIPRSQEKPLALLIFYRVWIQSENICVIDQLIASFQEKELDVIPVFASSLKSPKIFTLIGDILKKAPVDIICTTTGFSLGGSHGLEGSRPAIFAHSDAPLLHIILSSGTQEDWEKNKHGLSQRDIAMHVALPEMDGRIIGKAVSFKYSKKRDDLFESDILCYRPVKERCDFMAELAFRWCRLRKKKPEERRVAMVLSNYPHRDGRLANGVGLDSPASAITILTAMQQAGYHIEEPPQHSDHLMDILRKGPTNQYPKRGFSDARLSAEAYQAFFLKLPETLRNAVIERWGLYDQDPFFRKKDHSFILPITLYGHIVIGLQPGRGYNIDPDLACHDSELSPPHSYLAFYFWLRHDFDIDALIHLGKHGTLEWLPGKALALSNQCWPEQVLGATPVLYPFIVNDPGEGAQAKRRTQSVIIDHLTPPLARAESHGVHAELENLLDEYYEAVDLDTKRTQWLKRHILDYAENNGLLADSDIKIQSDDALIQLDGYLCTLKTLQIRHGLHRFGENPSPEDTAGLLFGMLKNRRGSEAWQDSLLRALADDLGLQLDPLNYDAAQKWTGPVPSLLSDYKKTSWHIVGDVVAELEDFAFDILRGKICLPAQCVKAGKIIEKDGALLRQALEDCAGAEIEGLLNGLAGKFVLPGPAGAPTRGRFDVLPTGRNFWSLDIRAIPSMAAWDLGWKSASLLLEYHMQNYGNWPRHMALSAWGTSCMRTGGEDAAQMLALMGVRPLWENQSRRVNGFEILPLSVLARPRVDVTLRISGFFRDAFPNLIDLIDSAVQAVGELDEPDEDNPLAASFQKEQADQNPHARIRIFGPAPGTYGTGLQTHIDQSHWKHDYELAESFLKWGGFGFTTQKKGLPQQQAFQKRIEKIDAVIHNQDNREHDILDSDDYYQFEGGLALAVRHLSKRTIVIYHNDHSIPDAPKIGTLEQEIARIVRARATNPKWIASAIQHGYKGAFEMAATVDYLFAFAVTARAVKNHHFDALFNAYIRDDTTRQFIENYNPDALKDILDRFQEAKDRNLWHSVKNDTDFLIKSHLKNIAEKDLKLKGG